jgi:hypothetical protein
MGVWSGDGRLSVRARPSTFKRDCGRWTTSTGERFLVNVHAKSRLNLETSGDTPVRNQGARPEPARTDAGHPLQGVGQSRREKLDVPVACPISRSSEGSRGHQQTTGQPR